MALPITYSLADLFNDNLSEYKWSCEALHLIADRRGYFNDVRTAVAQSLELRVRLRSHYATNFEDQEHGWRKRYGLVFADTTSLLTFNMDSTPGQIISKNEQYSFAQRMKTEFPEGKEYIIELFQDHYTALKEMALDPEDAVKYGTLQPYILQLRRPTFCTPTANTTDIVRVDDAAWPYVHRLNDLREVFWPAHPAVPLLTIPDLSTTFGRVTGSIISFIGHVVRVEHRKQDNSTAQERRNSTPAFTIKFVDIALKVEEVLQSINIFSNANTVLLHGLLSISRACPAVAVFTGFSRNDQYISSTSSSRVQHLESETDIEQLFQEQLSAVMKATIVRHMKDDVSVRYARKHAVQVQRLYGRVS